MASTSTAPAPPHDGLHCTWSDTPVATEPTKQNSALGGFSYFAVPDGLARAVWNADAGTVQIIGLDGKPLGPAAAAAPALSHGEIHGVTSVARARACSRASSASRFRCRCRVHEPEPTDESIHGDSQQKVGELVRIAADGSVKSVRPFARSTWGQAAIRVIPAGNCFVLWGEQAIRAVSPKLDLVGERLTGPNQYDRAHRIVRVGDEHSTRVAVIWLPSDEEFTKTAVQVLDAGSASWVAPARDLGVEIHELAPLGDNAVLVGETYTPAHTTVLEGMVVHPDGSVGPWQRWYETTATDVLSNVIIGQRPDGHTLLQFSAGTGLENRSWAVEVKQDGALAALGEPATSSHINTIGLVGGDGIYEQDNLAIYRWTCN